MKDKDQHLLWEAYTEKRTPKHDEDDEKGKYDDGDDKEERCDYVPCEEENVQEEETYGAEGAEDEESDEDDIQEEAISAEPGIGRVTDAINNLTGENSDDGDWELAIKSVCEGIADFIIYNANPPKESAIVGSVIDDPELADRWDFKTGVKDALVNLLDGSTYDELSKGFKHAFHKAKKDDEDGRFDFSNETLLKRMKQNFGKKLDHDDAPMSHPREREREDGAYLKKLGL